MRKKSHDIELMHTKTGTQRWLDRFAQNLFLVVMGSGTLLAAWLLMQNAAKNEVVHNFSMAAKEGDVHALNQATDWKSVRTWMKQDLKNRAMGAAGQTSGLPTEEAKVEQLVDYYVRPENIASLLYYYNANASHVDPEAFVRSVQFSGITEITVEIAAPPQLDKPWMNKLEPVRAVFALDGMQWKLKKINAPDYLIPRAAPTEAFLKTARAN